MTHEPESKPKLSLEEQITDIVLKTVKTGGIAGGVIGAFWQLFMASDIPEAIASALIGAGISYGAKMLIPIHKGNEEGAEKFGNAINEGLNRAGGAVVAKVTSIEERYFEAQAADCDLCRTEGVGKMDNIATPMFLPRYKRLSIPVTIYKFFDPSKSGILCP